MTYIDSVVSNVQAPEAALKHASTAVPWRANASHSLGAMEYQFIGQIQDGFCCKVLQVKIKGD